MALANKLIDSWRDAYSVRRVFGDPIEKDGLVIIPVAMVSGGGGGGSGPAESTGDGDGEVESGGGFGGMARPVGVFVVSAEDVQWRPAFDVTVLGLAGLALGGLVALVLGRALRRKR
jgi:uncharacterized spore protein YtfJ